MKRDKLVFLFLLCMLTGTLYGAEELCRKSINFNRDWKYIRGDHMDAERIDYNDTTWEKVGIPHSFSIPYFMSKDFYTGYGWYRKNFVLTAEDMKQTLFVEFDGVFQEAEVFVNGRKIGVHVGGYTGFYFDISSAARMGDNVIAVRVNNIWKADVAPRAGEHVFSGGIYRNVRLVKKASIYIDWYGTSVTTPDLAKKKGKSSVVGICTDVCNKTDKPVEFTLFTEVKDADGQTLATVESKETLDANSVKRFEQTTGEMNRLNLWCPQRPYLYKLVSSIYRGQILLDRTETAFGFRWFEWTADKGFFLNGEHLYLKGVNVHQDQAGWGDAVTEAAMYRDVGMMKEAGFDLIRGSHYPHAPAFSRACDELGMLFWPEAPFWGIGGYKPDGYWNSSAYPIRKEDEEGFEESALQQLREMIRIHRNHPSIVVWSISNEAFFSAPEAMPGVRRLLKRMVDLVHQLDPARPVAVGGAQRPLGEERIDRIGDIAGYNGDGATQTDFQNPGIPNIVSEYGSTTADRPGEYGAGWGDLQKDNGWKGRTWRSGQAIWCGFDHGSIAGSALGKMGIVDYFRIPKRSWYWYRNEYAKVTPPVWAVEGIPAQLKLEATKTNGVLTDGTDDVQLMVTVLDASGNLLKSAPPVQLKLISGPGEFPTGSSILFEKDSDIRILDGQAAISFRSYYAGKALIEATSPRLKPARIEIHFVGSHIHEPGVTPVVKPRPYVRFVRENNESVVQTFGCNNPAFASSQQGKQSAGLAADGNMNTFWQAAGTDSSSWWMLDTEKELTIHHIEVRFPTADIYHYTIEVSNDNKEWRIVLDKRSTLTKERKVDKAFAVEEVLTGRFIRVNFVGGSPATISEVEVKGTVCE